MVESFSSSGDFRVFAEASDRLWLWLHLRGSEFFEPLADRFPALPPQELQLQFTGKVDQETLRDGFRVYRMFRDRGRHALGGSLERSRMLDFGCGWGRVARFFLRDVEPGSLFGFDVEEAVLDAAREQMPSAHWQLVEPLPPSGAEDGSFDLIYSYSVFSHLSEEAHLRWLEEFQRLLRPGGVLAVTTRPREFIAGLQRRRRRGEDSSLIPAAFHDAAGAERRYDAGEYVHEGIGGGGALEPSFFGETCIPPAYVRERWTELFEVVEQTNYSEVGEQNLIVVRRP
jgi:SAM-dependent methyltransferase